MTKLLEPGNILQGYKLLEKVGTGAFASVWSAEHILTKTKVGIKIIVKASVEESDAKIRFNREIALLKQLRHPFIAELFEHFDDEENFYIVMEYAPKGNLLDFVNTNGRIPENQARRYFSQLIQVLEYLHLEVKVAHRDLKAENIMLDENNNIRVIDFGLSNQFTAENSQLNTACGSPAYAAPEMIKGNKYTKAADIWSSGVLLYSMVAGQLPYDDDNIQRLLQKIVYTDVKYPGFFTPALIDLLKKMLTKAPDMRIDIPKIKEHYWFSQFEYSQLTTKFLYESAQQDQVIDKEIIDQLQALGVDTKSVHEAILSNEFSAQAAAYRMLAKTKMTRIIDNVMKNLVASGGKPQAKQVKIGQGQAFPSKNDSQNFPTRQAFPSASPRGDTKILQTPAPVQIAARRLSRPVAVRRTIDLPTAKSHES